MEQSHHEFSGIASMAHSPPPQEHQGHLCNLHRSEILGGDELVGFMGWMNGLVDMAVFVILKSDCTEVVTRLNIYCTKFVTRFLFWKIINIVAIRY